MIGGIESFMVLSVSYSRQLRAPSFDRLPSPALDSAAFGEENCSLYATTSDDSIREREF